MAAHHRRPLPAALIVKEVHDDVTANSGGTYGACGGRDQAGVRLGRRGDLPGATVAESYTPEQIEGIAAHAHPGRQAAVLHPRRRTRERGGRP